MKFNIKTLFLIIAVVMGINGVSFAQVKIGTAPTTIDSRSNLEVQAANNKKVIVHKDDGTVVIENIPVGAVTDSLMTWDNLGNVRWIDRATLKTKLGQSGSGSMITTGSEVANGGVPLYPDYTVSLPPDDLGSIDLIYNRFLVKSSGIYTFSCTVDVTIPGLASDRANVDLLLQVYRPGAPDYVNIGRTQAEENGTYRNLQTITITDHFNVGEIVRVGVYPCNTCIAGNPPFTLNSARFFGLKHY